MSSGADLARTALAAAKAAARKQNAGGKQAKRKRLTSVQRGSGRDPVGLGAALGAIAAAQGWDLQTRAGSLTDRWAELAPAELVDLVRPERFDADSRTLHLRPATHAAASMLRLKQRQLVDHLNQGLGRDVIATLRVLPVGGGFTAVKPAEAADRFSAENSPASSPARPRLSGASPSAEMREWRDTYREQRAARDTEAPSPASRWFDGAYGRLREPEQAFRDAVIAQQEAAADTTPVDQAARSAASHARALAAARGARRTGDPSPLHRAAGAA